MSDIDWSSAELQDGTLTVGLTDKPSKEWRERLVDVAQRLGHDRVAIAKQPLVVEWVAPGTEGDIRHLLEAAVLQANADLAPDDAEEGDELSEEDREMTEAF